MGLDRAPIKCQKLVFLKPPNDDIANQLSSLNVDGNDDDGNDGNVGNDGNDIDCDDNEDGDADLANQLSSSSEAWIGSSPEATLATFRGDAV